jgi:hypothetical protein
VLLFPEKERSIMQYPYQTIGFSRNIVILDMKQGDVNGDRYLDTVYLYGNKPEGPSGIFADNITLVIEDGLSKQRI